MIEVPITMVLVVVAIMIGLGLFSFFIAARFIVKRISNQPEDPPKPVQRQLPTPPQEIQAKEEIVLTGDRTPAELLPLLIIGVTENSREKMVWKVENPSRQLKRGLLSRSEEELLVESRSIINRLLSVEEIENAPANLVLPTMPAVQSENKPIKGGLNLLSRDKPVVEAPVSMAIQMNALLQNMLMAMPGESKNLRIEDGPQGDLRIWLNSKSYNSLDELPDSEARDLIRQAAEEWVTKNASKH